MTISKGFANRWKRALAYRPAQVRVHLVVSDHPTVVDGVRDYDSYALTYVQSGTGAWYMQTCYLKDGKSVYNVCNCADFIDPLTHKQGGAWRPHPYAGLGSIPQDAMVCECKHTMAAKLRVLLDSSGIEDIHQYATIGAAYAAYRSKQ